MKRYEYKIIKETQHETVAVDPQGKTREERVLETAGAEGWELCAIIVHITGDRTLYLKRERCA